VRLSARKGELHIVGKGEKFRTVPVHSKLRGTDRLARRAILSPRRGLGRVVHASSRGTRMTAGAIADVIGAITRPAGLDDHVTVHDVRHTFGTELTEAASAS
jgi:integrase/recombinase XerD